MNKRRKDLASRLQQRVSNYNLQELFQPRATALNHIIAETIRKYLSRQRRDCDSGALTLQNVAEILKVGVATTDAALAQLEGGDVGSAQDFVVGVHGAADAVGAGVSYLRSVSISVVFYGRGHGSSSHLNLQKVLGWPVDLFEALLARVGHGLHHRSVHAGTRRGGGRLRARALPGVLCVGQFGGVEGSDGRDGS